MAMFFEGDCTGSVDRSELVKTRDHSVFTVLNSIYAASSASSTFDFITESFFELVLMFGNWYKAVESEAPLYVNGSPRWKDELFKVEYHETLFTVLSDIAKRVGSVEVKSVKQNEDDMQRDAAGHPVDVEEGSSGDKRKRNGKDDGTVEKEADASTKGSKRSKTGKPVTSRKRTSKKSNR